MVGAVPVTATAQLPFTLTSSTKDLASAAAELGGTEAIDIISLRPMGPGSPLRFGGVVPKSERVTLDNEVLTSGSDYFMDYSTGVVYLKRAQKSGQTMIVSYRYTGKTDAAANYTGLGAMKYSLVPGGLNLLLGMGMTERQEDGSVLSGNVFGMHNNFGLGKGGSLGGLMLMGDRDQVTPTSGLSMDPNAKKGGTVQDKGKSQLLLQNLTTNMLGGKAEFTYQDISKNFTAFNAISSDSGLDAARIKQLQSERGLTRFGAGLSGLKFGQAAFSGGYRKVGDDKGGIQWRSFGIQQGLYGVSFSSQKVDTSFNHFKEIAEADREQLLKEKGISRQNFAAKLSSLSYTNGTITDDATGLSVVSRDVVLDAKKFKLLVGDRRVDAKFNRFDSLLGTEKATFGREAGLNRNYATLTGALGKANLPFAFSQQSVRNETGAFQSQEASLAGKGWSLSHVSKSTDEKFVRVDGLQDSEMDGHIKSIATMYGPGVASKPEDRAQFLKGQGLSREFNRIGVQPFKNWDVSVEQLRMRTPKDDASVDTYGVKTSNLSANYRKQNIGTQFLPSTSLMGFETAKLGTISGMERSDFGMAMQLTKSKSLSIGTMSASTAAGSLDRTALAYKDNKVDLQVNSRNVSKGFDNANLLVDPEKDLLNSLRGYRERDVKLKWQALPNLKFDFSSIDAENPDSHDQKFNRNAVLDWSPDKNTSVNYTQIDQKNNNPLSTLFAQLTERLMVSKNFGRFGKVQLLDERLEYSGQTATQPDSHRHYISYETQIDKNTSVKTEQTHTDFSNGEKEDTSANTLSTTLTKRVGVQVTDVKVNRTGDQHDEAKRNYGFWYDFGNGMRLSYGYNRQMSGLTTGTMNSTVTIGQAGAPTAADQVGKVQAGAVGDMMLGAGYGVNEWDGSGATADRTQAFSNVSLSTAKAFRLGMFKELKFNVAVDTATDYTAWVRENRQYGLSGKVGTNGFAYDYRSQMDKSGFRAIDRTFKFNTDQTDKRHLTASLFYKVRTLPNNDQVMIRQYDVTARPAKNFELTNQIVTNPEVANSNAMLGSIPQAAKSNKWKLDYKRDGNFVVGGSWEELVNEQNKSESQIGGINFVWNQLKGSPITLFCGVEQKGTNGVRQTATRYHIQFDRKPSKNQVFSLFLGNVSYDYNPTDGLTKNNWTARLDWQIKF